MELPKEALEEYLSEGDEIIQRVVSNLSLFENSNQDETTLDSIYRDMHTLKGSSMLFGFNNIGELSHTLEACLDPIRKTKAKLTPELVNIIYKALDLIEKYLLHIRGHSCESKNYNQEKIEVLSSLIDISTSLFGRTFSVSNDFWPNVTHEDEMDLSNLKKQLPKSESIKTEIAEPIKPISDFKNIIPLKSALEVDNISENKISNENSVLIQEEIKESNKSQLKDTTIRVSVDLLDRMMNLVGELVLVRNQVLQYARELDNLEFVNLSQNLNIVTSDLQAEVMKTRMQPIGNVLNKFGRVVRDIANDLGKKVRLDLIGMDTELDKTLLEAIRDPLTHIIRNSCDHGIETPIERVKIGKLEEGVIYVKSYHEGGQVIIEISDNGRGLQKSKIISKALENGIINSDKVKKMTDREVFELILMPGFSTAEKVSSVSGRGVGMDVVKTNIEKIGGTVEINSDEGKGTEIRLKIPLTLAIVPAMLIRVGEMKFCIPQIRLVELVRVDNADKTKNKVELLQGQPVFRLRGELLPLVNLEELLSKNNSKFQKRDLTTSTVNIVVLNSDGVQFGLVVDDILDTADIVVKPLSQFLKSLGVFSGATIMGDGSVALILDVIGLSEKANIVSQKEDSHKDYLKSDTKKINKTMVQEFLTFSISQKNKYSIPLCLVHRLEKFDQKQIEFTGEQRVVQYRGDLLPIVSLKTELGFSNDLHSNQLIKTNFNSTDVNIIVAQKSGMFFGIQVDDIEDVVSTEEEINESVSDREQLLGNIIVDNSVIVVVDVLSILDRVIEKISLKNRMIKNKVEKSTYKIHKGAKILLAEDTPFFRRKISSVLNKAGYDVTTVNNGQEALEYLKNEKKNVFNIILSDIEMPFVDGFQLAESLRKNPNFDKTPLIAITTRFRDRDIEKGKKVGFNDYLEKLNEEELLKSIDKLLSEGA